MSITPKNWNTFQHYKDRSPAWIKLHRGLLHDYAFSRLPVASRALAPMLWLLASEYEGGKIGGDFDEVAYKLHMTKGEFCEALNPLIEGGFFILDSAALAERKQEASPEKRDIENIDKGEAEKKPSLRSASDWPPDFKEKFWSIYPKRVGKKAAISELERVRKRGDVPWSRLIAALTAYAGTADPKFTKDPERWLKKGCWDDEPDVRKPNGPSGNAILQSLDNTRERLKALGIRGGTGADHARLLSQGGGERPGDVFNGSGGVAVPVRTRGDSGGDTPTVRSAEQNGLHADAEGTKGGV